MIAFRQVDARYPLLWEDASQPSGRWHAAGDGPAHYFADTPDGAWAELLRHEEITDPDDLLTIRRQMWAVEIGDAAIEHVDLPLDVLTGSPDKYPECREAVRAIRSRGVHRVAAATASLQPGGARGVRVEGGVQPGDPRDGLTIVIFGSPRDLVAWVAAEDARPSVDLLDRVHHYDDAPSPARSGARQPALRVIAGGYKERGRTLDRREDA